MVTAQLWVDDELSLLWQRGRHSGSARHPTGYPKASTRGLLRLSGAEGQAVGPFNFIREASPSSPPLATCSFLGPFRVLREKELVLFSS